MVVHGSGKTEVPRASSGRWIRWSAPVLGLLGLLGLLLLLLLLLLKLGLSEKFDLILLCLKHNRQFRRNRSGSNNKGS